MSKSNVKTCRQSECGIQNQAVDSQQSPLDMLFPIQLKSLENPVLVTIIIGVFLSYLFVLIVF